MSEEEIIERLSERIQDSEEIDRIQVFLTNDITAIQGLLDLYKKEKEENGKLRVEFEKVYEDNLTLAKELEQEKEKNKELEEKCKEVVCVPEGTCFIAVPKNMISKDKVKEIIEKSFDEMLNHSNKFNCGDMQMLENNIVELLEEV